MLPTQGIGITNPCTHVSDCVPTTPFVF